MVSKKQIFVIFACDEHKSRHSMSLLMATTSVKKLRSFLANKIAADDFVYIDDDLDKKEQVKRFKYDFDNNNRTYINNNLIYGFYDYTHDGEEM